MTSWLMVHCTNCFIFSLKILTLEVVVIIQFLSGIVPLSEMAGTRLKAFAGDMRSKLLPLKNCNAVWALLTTQLAIEHLNNFFKNGFLFFRERFKKALS